MSKRSAALQRAIVEVGYAQGTFDESFPGFQTRSMNWQHVANSWNDLPTDTYMADNGKYRQRRYAEFQLRSEEPYLEDLATSTYRQSKAINYLNGGMARHYSPIKPAVKCSVAFRRILGGFHSLLGPLGGHQPWLVQVFQNRILAQATELGYPTPEGVHRDGVDYVLTVLVRRHNVTGGESSVHCGKSGDVLSRVTLRTPGDFILLDDNRMRHAVEPIAPSSSNSTGYRDVLIAMFTAQPKATQA